MKHQCSARWYDGAVKVNSVKKILKEHIVLCFALEVSSIYSFSVNPATVSVDTFYSEDRPKSTHQNFKNLGELD